ncbi:restriction endonuclease [Streptomyces fumanus]|uniref:Restriction endonuclease n=1 Tax=Streptomyces fumanus TaxID=67302 RepID=A0A919AA48_9ACTN|nr:restriction endonuclease [Streptomyces fumanus]GHE93272.1 restriction endonuclease [Streptomyces fumanus]
MSRTRRIRLSERRRSFDLRATAVFFGLLALLVIIMGFAVRWAAAALRHRPGWGIVLALVVTAAVLHLCLRRHRRGFSAKRAAHQAAVALEEATHTALDVLETPAPATAAPGGAGSPAVPAPRTGHTAAEPTVPLPGGGAAADASATLVSEPAPDEPLGETLGETLDYATLDPDEFEQAIAALCERDGCSRAEVVGGAGDLGADVLAVAPDGRRIVIQCKRYGDGNRVGSQDLQRFGGTCYTVHEADVAVIVTTSDFTAPAVEYAEQCGIVCVDGAALRAWSDGTAPAPWTAPVPEGPRR